MKKGRKEERKKWRKHTHLVFLCEVSVLECKSINVPEINVQTNSFKIERPILLSGSCLIVKKHLFLRTFIF